MKLKSYLLIFILFMFFVEDISAFKKATKLKIFSVQYPEKIYQPKGDNSIRLPIVVTFFNKKMILLYLGRYPEDIEKMNLDPWVLETHLGIDDIMKKLIIKKPVKEQKPVFSYKVQVGYDAEITLKENNKEIKTKFCKVMKGEYSYHWGQEEYRKEKYRTFEFHEFLIPENYFFPVRLPDLHINLPQGNINKGCRCKLEIIRVIIKNPYLKIFTPSFNPITNKEYEEIRFVTKEKIEIFLRVERDIDIQRIPFVPIKEKIFNPDLKNLKLREKEIDGYWDISPPAIDLDKEKAKTEKVYKEKMKTNLFKHKFEYAIDIEDKIKVNLFKGKFKNYTTCLSFEPQVFDVMVRGRMILGQTRQVRFKWFFCNTYLKRVSYSRGNREFRRFPWFDSILTDYHPKFIIKIPKNKKPLLYSSSTMMATVYKTQQSFEATSHNNQLNLILEGEEINNFQIEIDDIIFNIVKRKKNKIDYSFYRIKHNLELRGGGIP